MMLMSSIIASGLASLGASFNSNGRQLGEAKHLIFTVLDQIFRRPSRALTSCRRRISDVFLTRKNYIITTSYRRHA